MTKPIRFGELVRLFNNALVKDPTIIRVACLLFLAAGCNRAPQPPLKETESLPDRPQDVIISGLLRNRAARAEGDPLFERLSPSQTGVDFSHRLTTDHQLSLLNNSGFVCGGVCIGDFNGDDRPDLFLVSGPDKNGLFLQTGDFRFKEMERATGVDGGDAWGAGAVAADFDEDGDLDLFVCNYDAPNQLFVNDGTGTHFTEEAKQRGLAMVDASLMPAFADHDR